VSPDPAAVTAAAAAWVYVPPDAREVRTEEFHLVAYPLHWADPTVATSLAGTGTPAALVDAVLAAARELGRDVVDLCVTAGSRPAGLVEHLLARGAVVHEELAILARGLDGADGLPDLDVPTDVEVREVTDLATARAAEQVTVEVFGGTLRDDDALMAEVERASLAEGVPVVAHRGGRAVGAAGLTVRDDVLRLWGGAVLEPARGTGVYRALLAHRLRAGVEHGCATALVKGRLTTSAPVLARAGFASYGTETAYRLG
jgi:GNAT superfamily N-acetyltransferase